MFWEQTEGRLMARGLDHIVVAVKDLGQAAKDWEALGFTVTPENRHPWGTSNRLVQLDGFFVEILTIADEVLIDEARPGVFSFGAFNRDYLKTLEGASMLVAEGKDPEADQQSFVDHGLTTYEPFSFSRVATFKDGTTGRVAFDLNFTTDASLPDLAFFTCRNRYPETFWNKTFQTHENGAAAIKAVYLVSDDPKAHEAFLTGFTGVEATPVTETHLEFQTPRGSIVVFGAEEAEKHLGAAVLQPQRSGPYIACLEIDCGGKVDKRIAASDLNGMALKLS